MVLRCPEDNKIFSNPLGRLLGFIENCPSMFLNSLEQGKIIIVVGKRRQGEHGISISTLVHADST